MDAPAAARRWLSARADYETARKRRDWPGCARARQAMDAARDLLVPHAPLVDHGISVEVYNSAWNPGTTFCIIRRLHAS